MLTTQIKNMYERNTKQSSYDFENGVEYKDFVEDGLPEHMIFPEELNRLMRDRIRDLIAENGCLHRALEEIDEKFQNLQEPRVFDSMINVGRTNEIIATKIMKLSKTCRELRAEVEVLRSKCKNLETKLASKEIELEHERTNGRENETCSPKDQLTDKQQIQLLNKSLQRAKEKLYTSKNSYTLLKQEMNKAQKLLCCEVGDNVSIAELSNCSIGWKGRAEQIQILQQKMAGLQDRLSKYEGSRKESSVTADQRNLLTLRNIEKGKKQQVENLTKELRQTEVALEASRRMQEVARARIKILENELAATKRSVNLLNEKRTHDDQLIEALKRQLKVVEDKFEERELQIQNHQKETERESIRLNNELNEARINIEQLQRKVVKMETWVHPLRIDSVAVTE